MQGLAVLLGMCHIGPLSAWQDLAEAAGAPWLSAGRVVLQLAAQCGATEQACSITAAGQPLPAAAVAETCRCALLKRHSNNL